MNICLWMVPLAIQAASFQERVESMQWHEIEAEARGQTVNWHMWGGNKDILRWVNGYSKTRLANEYGVKLNVVPLENVKKTINQVRDERRKGISSNAKSKAGAMVLANLILDPATQFEKMKPTVWGDQPILDTTKLPKKWRAKFESFPRHPSTLSREELTAHQLPELQSSWVLHI